MAEIKFTGAFGYRALGTTIQQCALIANEGSVVAAQVAYTTKNGRKVAQAGAILDDFNPESERIYTYSAVRRALQGAGTSERLFGLMSLVGPEGGLTMFAKALGGTKTFTVEEWVNKLTFDDFDPKDVYESLVQTYKEVNED